jgi:hypothetical protein
MFGMTRLLSRAKRRISRLRQGKEIPHCVREDSAVFQSEAKDLETEAAEGDPSLRSGRRSCFPERSEGSRD